MCLNSVANYWHFHEYHNHMLCKWLEKNLNHRTFQKAVILLVGYNERKTRKKNSFQFFLVVFWLEDLSYEIEFVIVYFSSCVCVCVYQVRHQQSVCTQNVTKPHSSFDQEHSSYHVWQQHSRGVYVYQSWQWAGTRVGLTPPQENLCNCQSWCQLGLAQKVKKVEASWIFNTTCKI